MKPSSMPKLTPWPGLEPAVGTGEAMQWPSGAQRRRLPWLWLVAGVVIVSLIAIVVLERRRANAAMERLAIEARAAPAPQPSVVPQPVTVPVVVGLETGTIAKAIPVGAPPLAREFKLSPAQSEEIARPLLTRLLEATTDAERLACIAFPARNAERLKTFFTRHATVELKALTEITKPVRCLPATNPQPLFDVATNLSADSSGILRLATSDDGELKIDWQLLGDSLEGAFAAYQKNPQAEPQWISLGLRRNFGFSEAPDLRETNYFFDVQGYGNGTDRALVQLPKDSPTGRSMDQALAWGELYIVRILLGWQQVNGTQRMTIINAVLDANDADQ